MKKGITYLAAALAMLLAVCLQTVLAQDLRHTLFSKTDQLIKNAQEKHAQVLSPDNYNRGMKAYQEADYNFKKGRDINSIRKELTVADKYMQQALQAIKLAEVTFASVMKARDDAYKAGGPQHAPQLWQEAERVFIGAAGELEDGDVKDAQKQGAEAEAAYRSAELNAIKNNYLNETRNLLVQAEQLKVKNYAPKTLEKARQLLAQAEQELNRNRYDTDLPRSLARQAKYEAKHAIYLSTQLQKVKAKKVSMEELLLEYEKPLVRVAAAADIVAELDEGHSKTTAELVEYIETLQSEAHRLRQDVASMEERLGGVASESRLLKERETIRLKAASIEELFSRDEATVLRKGNDIIIRMIGLNFDVGKAEIKARNFALLSKVKKAIAVFPDSRLAVEGHTDSYGGDAANMALSRERAEAVRRYIIENMAVDPGKIEALGYGETRPVANNETPEGREKNRRIDIVLNI